MTPESAWFVADADEDTKRAFIAFSQCVASARQQAIVGTFLIQQVARTHDVSARPDASGGLAATYFAEGRRFVGLQVIRLMNQSLVAAKPEPTGEKPNAA